MIWFILQHPQVRELQAHSRQLMHFLRRVGRLQSVIICQSTEVFVYEPHFHPCLLLFRRRPFCSRLFPCCHITKADVLKPFLRGGSSDSEGFVTLLPLVTPALLFLHRDWVDLPKSDRSVCRSASEAPSSLDPCPSWMAASTNEWQCKLHWQFYTTSAHT